MRTKALVCALAFAASIGATVAQNVYSLNVVGYYNIPVAAGAKVMIANQLNTTNNTIGVVDPQWSGELRTSSSTPVASRATTFDDFDMVWLPDGNATLNPGEGAFYQSPVATTLTFVGEVLQGTLVNTLPIGQKVMRSSMVPQAGLVTTDLGLPGEATDNLYTWTGGYTAIQFDDLDMVWLPSEPTIDVGQAFFYNKAAGNVSSTWTRNFTVQ